jgi:hypothetical protein
MISSVNVLGRPGSLENTFSAKKLTPGAAPLKALPSIVVDGSSPPTVPETCTPCWLAVRSTISLFPSAWFHPPMTRVSSYPVPSPVTGEKSC